MSNDTLSGKKPEKTLASSVWRQLRFPFVTVEFEDPVSFH